MYLLQTGWSTSNTLVAVSMAFSFFSALLTMYVTLRITTLKSEMLNIMAATKAELIMKIETKFESLKSETVKDIKDVQDKMVTRDNMNLMKENLTLKGELDYYKQRFIDPKV